MMEFVFLFCWTGGFLAGLFLVLGKIVSRYRVYLLLFLNLIFLAGVFYFYPVPGPETHSGDVSLTRSLELSPGGVFSCSGGWS